MFSVRFIARSVVSPLLCLITVTVVFACSKGSGRITPHSSLANGGSETSQIRFEKGTIKPSIGLNDPYGELLSAPADVLPNLQTTDGFTLVPYDTGNAYNPQLNKFIRMSVSDSADGKTVAVSASGVRDMKFALFEIRYDPKRYSPESIDFGDFLGAPTETIRFGATGKDGRVPIGIAITNYDKKQGADGDGILARIEFKRGDFDAARVESKVPAEPENRVTLVNSDPLGFRCAFQERNIGDYDNNGEVGIADITPIALNYLQNSASSIGAANADGDEDGVVGIPDITPIATHYLNLVASYKVYRIESVVAPDKTDFTEAALWRTIPRPQELTGNNPRPSYSLTDPDSGPTIWYAAAATDGQGNDGLMSNVLQGALPTAGPVVNFVAPTEGQDVYGLVNVKVNASGDSQIASVQLFIDDMVTPVATLTSQPYEYSWNTNAYTVETDHVLRAVATDIASRTGQAEITVHNIIFGVELTPPSGSEISGIATIEATIIGAVNVTQIDFFIDDLVTPVATDSTSPFTYDWDTTVYPTESDHLVRAVATDDQSRTSLGEVTLRNVYYTLMVEPPDGSSFDGGVRTIEVTSDYTGALDISFNIDGSNVGTDNIAPYTYDWNVDAATLGFHTVAINAVDDQSRNRNISVDYRKRDVLPGEWDVAKNTLGLRDATMGPGNDIFGIPVDVPIQPLNWGDPYVSLDTVLPIFWNAWLADPESFPTVMRDKGAEIRDAQSLQNVFLAATNEMPSRFQIGQQSHGAALDPTNPLAVEIADFVTAAGGTPDLPSYITALSPLAKPAQDALAPVVFAASQALAARNQAFTNIGVTQADMIPFFNYGHGSVSGLAVLAIDPAHYNDMAPIWVPENYFLSGFPYSDAFFIGAATLTDAIDDLTAFMETNPAFANVNLDIDTPAGRITIGGTGNDTHAIAPSGNGHAILIDLGGNDTYNCHAGGTASIYNGVAVAIDLSGDDTYNRIDDPNDFDRTQGWSDDDTSQQGAGRFGIGMLVDYGGNDEYYSVRMSQGSCVFGVGILADYAGNDYYENEALGQGAAFAGVAICYDQSGSDEFDAWAKSQGCGLVMGVGFLINKGSDIDTYTAHQEQNPSKPEYYADVYGSNMSNCQGAAWGSRWGWLELSDNRQVVASGGFGLLFDEGGDDEYTCGVFGEGCGFFQGTGMLIDLDGDDTHDGWWYTNGATAHVAVGGLWDGGGDDSYLNLRSVGIGGAHDWSVTWFMERDGNDSYDAANLDLGAGNANGFGYFIDMAGDDSYTAHDGGGENATLGRGVFGGETRTDQVTYGIFIDVAGTDTYDPKYAGMLAGIDNSTVIDPTPADSATWIRSSLTTHGDGFYELEKGIGIDSQ